MGKSSKREEGGAKKEAGKAATKTIERKIESDKGRIRGKIREIQPEPIEHVKDAGAEIWRWLHFPPSWRGGARREERIRERS